MTNKTKYLIVKSNRKVIDLCINKMTELNNNYPCNKNIATDLLNFKKYIIPFNYYEAIADSDLPPKKWTQRRENGSMAMISKEVSDGRAEIEAI